MDTNTNFRISIPKPCHEDWNKFTPDEKGAFCKVCSKSVHDFTKKTPEEIKTVLVEEMSAGKKVCGRFNEDQITPCPEPAPALDTYSLNFQRVKKFAMALFLVFGGFLFNSVKSSAQKMGKVAYNYREPVRGEVAVAPAPEPVKDTTTAVPKIPKCGLQLKGDVAIEPTENIQTTVGQVAVIEEPIEMIVGELEVIEFIPPPVEDTTFTVESYPTMGLVVYTPEDIEPPTLIDPISSDSIQNIIDGEFAAAESTEVITNDPVEDKTIPETFVEDPAESLVLSSYPNPTSNGEITLRYNLKKDGFTSIILYDLNGKLVKTLLPLQSLYASQYETKYNVSDLKDGLYFCELTAGVNKITTQIVISK